MGAADVVPGVSGGTVAFITGIYEELIDSIKSIEPSLIPRLWREGPQSVWRAINGNFLLILFAGVFCSVFSLARLISFAIEQYPILVWSFFFGLIFASAILLWRQLAQRSWGAYLAMLIGFAAAFYLSFLTPGQTAATPLNLFLGGAIAVCAMILPGISGGFILLMMGLYSGVIDAIKGFELLNLLCIVGGAGLGLVLFSHVLSYLLHRFHAYTLALLTGFLFGSLNLIWPWKQILSTRINSHGQEVPLVQTNIMPWQYEALMDVPSNLLLGCCFCAVGIVLVMVLEKSGSKAQNN